MTNGNEPRYINSPNTKKPNYIFQTNYPDEILIQYADTWNHVLSASKIALFRIIWHKKEEPIIISKAVEKIADFIIDDDDDQPQNNKRQYSKKRNKPNKIYIPNNNEWQDYALTESDY